MADLECPFFLMGDLSISKSLEEFRCYISSVEASVGGRGRFIDPVFCFRLDDLYRGILRPITEPVQPDVIITSPEPMTLLRQILRGDTANRIQMQTLIVALGGSDLEIETSRNRISKSSLKTVFEFFAMIPVSCYRIAMDENHLWVTVQCLLAVLTGGFYVPNCYLSDSDLCRSLKDDPEKSAKMKLIRSQLHLGKCEFIISGRNYAEQTYFMKSKFRVGCNRLVRSYEMKDILERIDVADMKRKFSLVRELFAVKHAVHEVPGRFSSIHDFRAYLATRWANQSEPDPVFCLRLTKEPAREIEVVSAPEPTVLAHGPGAIWKLRGFLFGIHSPGSPSREESIFGLGAGENIAFTVSDRGFCQTTCKTVGEFFATTPISALRVAYNDTFIWASLQALRATFDGKFTVPKCYEDRQFLESLGNGSKTLINGQMTVASSFGYHVEYQPMTISPNIPVYRGLRRAELPSDLPVFVSGTPFVSAKEIFDRISGPTDVTDPMTRSLLSAAITSYELVGIFVDFDSYITAIKNAKKLTSTRLQLSLARYKPIGGEFSKFIGMVANWPDGENEILTEALDAYPSVAKTNGRLTYSDYLNRLNELL